jgi:hypothetical protein
MLIGNAGQRRRFFLTGVLYVQMSWRSRRRGDENMICRHRRHTCANLCHSNTGRMRTHPVLLSVRQKSNISSKSSSGSELIVNGCLRLLPMPHTSQHVARPNGNPETHLEPIISPIARKETPYVPGRCNDYASVLKWHRRTDWYQPPRRVSGRSSDRKS